MGVTHRHPRLTRRTFEQFVLQDIPRSGIRTFEDARRSVAATALTVECWNIERAARRLGTNRRTLYRMIERWGMSVANERARAVLDEELAERAALRSSGL